MGGEPSFDDPGLGVPSEEAIQEIVHPTAQPGAASLDPVFFSGDLEAPTPVAGVGTRPGIGGRLGSPSGGSFLGEAGATIASTARKIATPSRGFNFTFFDAVTTILTGGASQGVRLATSFLGSAIQKALGPSVSGPTLLSASVTPEGSVKVGSPALDVEYETDRGVVGPGDHFIDPDTQARLDAGLPAEAEPYDPDRPGPVSGPPEGGYDPSLFAPMTDEELDEEERMSWKWADRPASLLQ